MAKNKMRLPSSEGGLVKYYDEAFTSKFQVKPDIIVAVCAAVIVFGIALNALF